MIKARIRIAAVAIALIVLTGCNLPFVGRSNQVNESIRNKAEMTSERIAGEPLDSGDSEGEGTEDGSIAGYTDDTNINECLQGCGYLTGVGMFSKEFCQDSCWAGEAKDTGDSAICDNKIANRENNVALIACYMNAAETSKDVKACDKLANDPADAYRGACYTSVATATRDASVCEGIKDTFLFTGCQAGARGE